MERCIFGELSSDLAGKISGDTRDLEHLPKPLPQVGMLNLFVQHPGKLYGHFPDLRVKGMTQHYEADQAGAGRQVESYAEGAACNLDGTGC